MTLYIWPLFDPLFNVTGRRKLDSLMRTQKLYFLGKTHVNLHFLEVNRTNWNLSLLTPYLKLLVEGNLIGQWGLDSRNPRSKTHGDSLLPGFNRLNGNLPLFDPLFDPLFVIFWLKEHRQPQSSRGLENRNPRH